MMKEGTVSLWVGHADSRRALEDYLEPGYTEDGDSIPSGFASAFGTEDDEEDYQDSREIRFYKTPTSSVRSLLKGYSYDDKVIAKFVELCGETLPEAVNVVVLLYDFKYSGRVSTHSEGAVKLRFVGCVKFE